MKSTFHYIYSVSFKVQYRRTILDVSLEIVKSICLKKVQIGKKEEVKFKVTMKIGKDLIGQVTTQDTWTKYKVSSFFDGRRLFHAHSLDINLVSSHLT